MRSRRRARSRLWVAISAARPVRRTRPTRVLEHAVAGGVVEIAGRLVGEQDLGVVGQCPDDRDPLLLAARQPCRAVLGARRQTDTGQQRRRLLPGPPAPDAGDHLRQHDVFERRKFRQQMMELIDETQLGAAQQGSVLVGEAAAILPADRDRAAIRAFEQPGDVQQGRLAGAGGADQRHHLARLQQQIDPVQHRDLGAAGFEGAAHSAQFERRRHQLPRVCRFTRSATPRPGRAGRRARMGRASPETTRRAP